MDAISGRLDTPHLQNLLLKVALVDVHERERHHLLAASAAASAPRDAASRQRVLRPQPEGRALRHAMSRRPRCQHGAGWGRQAAAGAGLAGSAARGLAEEHGRRAGPSQSWSGPSRAPRGRHTHREACGRRGAGGRRTGGRAGKWAREWARVWGRAGPSPLALTRTGPGRLHVPRPPYFRLPASSCDRERHCPGAHHLISQAGWNRCNLSIYLSHPLGARGGWGATLQQFAWPVALQSFLFAPT